MTTPTTLDTLTTVASSLDASGMAALLRRFAQDLAEGVEVAREVSVDWSLPDPVGVLCLGMGGSGAGGAALAALAERTDGAPPVVAVRDYVLPGWWTPEWVVVATSYSGNTEETLSAAQTVLARGGSLVVIASGGALSRLATEGAHLIDVPSGQPPRTAFGHLFGRLLGLAWAQGWLPAPEDAAWTGVVERIQALVERCDLATLGPAAEVAPLVEAMAVREVVLISAPELASMGTRFANQLNENAGVFARSVALPEMNHNEVVAWERGYDRAEAASVLLLEWPGEHERVALRAEWLAEALPTTLAWRIMCEGEDLVESMLYACVVMDWSSWGVAILRGKDPTSIGPIDALKAHLAAHA